MPRAFWRLLLWRRRLAGRCRRAFLAARFPVGPRAATGIALLAFFAAPPLGRGHHLWPFGIGLLWSLANRNGSGGGSAAADWAAAAVAAADCGALWRRRLWRRRLAGRCRRAFLAARFLVGPRAATGIALLAFFAAPPPWPWPSPLAHRRRLSLVAGQQKRKRRRVGSGALWQWLTVAAADCGGGGCGGGGCGGGGCGGGGCGGGGCGGGRCGGTAPSSLRSPHGGPPHRRPPAGTDSGRSARSGSGYRLWSISGFGTLVLSLCGSFTWRPPSPAAETRTSHSARSRVRRAGRPCRSALATSP